jgi:exosortase E/protease (VPEID-CTERM system)
VTRIALLALLIGEILHLTVRFDSQALDSSSSPWLRVVAWSPQYLRLAITVAVVFLLLRVRRVSTGRLQRPMSAIARTISVAVHLAALLTFVWISSRIFGPLPSAAEAPLLVISWLVVGMTVITSWGLAFVGKWPSLSERANRALAAAAVGLGVLAWLGGFLSESLWRTFAGYTFTIAAAALQLIYDDVVTRPDRLILGTRGFRVNIAPTCSGLEGVGLILAFLGIYLWLFRRELRFPAALILLPVGAVAIWLLNAVRIVVLIVIGSSGWRDIALGGFHSQAGWLTFNAVALGFVALVNRSGMFMKARADEPAQQPDDATAAYLAPFVVVLATAMITGAVSSGLDWLYPLRVIAAVAVLWFFRRHYTGLGWSVSWRAIAIGIVTFAMWILLVPAGPTARDEWPAALQAAPGHWAALWLLFRVIGYNITVPLVEELAFRAYLTRRLIAAEVDRVPLGTFTWSSFVISSLLFGLMHGSFWIAGTLAGMSFALALYGRRALGDAVAAHATANGLITVYVLVTGRWSMWS